jgi:hypothetical protein
MARYLGQLDGYIRERYLTGDTPHVIWLDLLEEYDGKPPISMKTVYNICKRFNEQTQRSHEANFRVEKMMEDIRRAVMTHLHLLPANLLRVRDENDVKEARYD